MLKLDDTVLVVIDIQGKLAHLMHNKEDLFENVRVMIRGTQILEVPTILTEQYPQGLGPTIPEVAELLEGVAPITKTAFSCCGETAFNRAFADIGRNQALLVGIETHVCVWQTAYDLLESEYEVHVAADAVSSRDPDNKQVGLQLMRDAGAKITCVETALFELMRVAGGPRFKQVSKLLK